MDRKCPIRILTAKLLSESRWFEDVSALAQACRFRDCCHQDEPGCAVRAQVSPERLKNYHKLLRESHREIMGVLER